MIIKHYVMGKWLAREFRSYLDGLRFMCYEIDWREERGWFEHHFFVKGDLNAILWLESHIERQTAENN